MFQESSCIIPAPFIVKEFFGEVPSDPLESILAVKQDTIDFNNTHSATAGFENVNATIQAKCFVVWAYTLSKDYIKEASFEIEPDNDELQKYLEDQHSKCILPSLATLSSAPINTSDHASILELLDMDRWLICF
jgi:hypothetical protein